MHPKLLTPLLLAGALLPSCAHLAPAADPAFIVRGPLASRVMQPSALIFPEPRPRRVATTEGWSGAATASYASVYEYAVVPPDEVELDGELLHVGLSLRRGLGPNTDVEVELPLLFGTSGFMDGFVDDFHALFGFPDGDREARPSDLYSMRLGSGGATLWELEADRLLLGDVPVTLTHRVRHADGERVGFALRGGVELPTGDEDDGSGSGDVDAFVGALFERHAGRWSWSGGVDWIAVETPSAYREGGARPSDIALGTLGLEYRWSDRASLLAGLRYRTPFTDDFEIKEVDRPVLDLGVGLARDYGWGRLYGAFHEDLVADSGPDLVLTLGLTFGR